MGISICSRVSEGELSKWNQFQCEKEYFSEEQDDDSSNLGGLSKCMSFPRRNDFEKVSQGKRAISEQVFRSRGYSLQERIQDWNRSPKVNRGAELQAERYCKIVTDDTLKHLSDTVRTADSIVEKCFTIRNELVRQNDVLSKAEADISIVEHDNDQNKNTLRGMSSWICKSRNVRLKKVKNINVCEEEELYTFGRTKCTSLSLSQCKSNDMQQAQIRAHMGQIDSAMDTIAVHQNDIACKLDREEGRFTRFENRLTNADEEINSQTRTIKRITKKF